MNTTLTIRLPASQRKALSAKAVAAGCTESEIVRNLIEAACAEQSVGERAGTVFGSVTLARTAPHTDVWRKQIRARNWRT